MAYRAKYPAYVLALIYLKRLKYAKEIVSTAAVTPAILKRCMIAAVTVAVKFFDDLYYSNEHYARELGLGLDMFNFGERWLLTSLQFDLTVSKVEYTSTATTFANHRQLLLTHDPDIRKEQQSPHCESLCASLQLPQQQQPWCGIMPLPFHPALLLAVVNTSSHLGFDFLRRESQYIASTAPAFHQLRILCSGSRSIDQLMNFLISRQSDLCR